MMSENYEMAAVQFINYRRQRFVFIYNRKDRFVDWIKYLADDHFLICVGIIVKM